MTLNTVTFESDSSSDNEVIIQAAASPSGRRRVRRVGRRKKIEKKVVVFDDSPSCDENVELPNPEIAQLYKHELEKEITEKKECETEEIKEKEIEEVKKDEKSFEDDEIEYVSSPVITKDKFEDLRKTIDRLPGRTISPKLIPYKFERKSVMTWKGIRLHFQFNRGDEPLFHAKLKGKKSQTTIYISKGIEAHISEKDRFATLIANDDFTGFSLIVNNGNQMESQISVSISFKHGSIPNSPRVCNVEFFTEIKGVEQQLTSKSPIIYPNGMWMLDLNGRVAVKSIKNCIIIDSEKNEIISLMKSGDNSAIAEAHVNIDPLFVFAFSMACFLCEI